MHRYIATTFVFAVALSLTSTAAAQTGTNKEIIRLIGVLEETNEAVRAQAVQTLANHGTAAVGELIEALGHKQQRVRIAAMQVLAKIGPAARQAVPLLGQILHKGDQTDSWQAASTLAALGHTAVPAVVKLTQHKTERARRQALWVLSSIKGDPNKLVPVLAKLLDSKHVAIRRHAALGLFRNTTKVVAPAVRALSDNDALVRAHCRNAMLQSGQRSPELMQALEKLLDHRDPGVRGDVFQVLAYNAEMSMKYGLRCIQDTDARVRGMAVQFLNTAAAPIERNPYTVSKIADKIAPLLTDASTDVRHTAFVMMRRSGSAGIPHLAKALDAHDKAIRQKAAETLLYHRAKNVPVIETKLRKLIEHDPVPDVRAAAVLAYSSLGPKSLPLIAKLIRKEQQEEVLVAAIYSISHHGEKAAFLVPVFIKALQDDSPKVRCAAAMSFYWMRKSGKQAIPALTKALKDKDAKTRRRAVYVLGGLGPESEPGIIEGIKGDDAQVQESALHTFWQRGFKSKQALPWLIKAVQKNSYSNIQHHAIYALANLGSDARKAIPLLEAMDPDKMNVHIQFGLRRIRGAK